MTVKMSASKIADEARRACGCYQCMEMLAGRNDPEARVGPPCVAEALILAGGRERAAAATAAASSAGTATQTAQMEELARTFLGGARRPPGEVVPLRSVDAAGACEHGWERDCPKGCPDGD